MRRIRQLSNPRLFRAQALPPIANTEQQQQPVSQLDPIAEKAYDVFWNEFQVLASTNSIEQATPLLNLLEKSKPKHFFYHEYFTDLFIFTDNQQDIYNNDQTTAYFTNHRTNELFVYICQELARQLHNYFLTGRLSRIAEYTAPRQNCNLEFLGFSDARRYTIPEDGRLSSNNSSDSLEQYDGTEIYQQRLNDFPFADRILAISAEFAGDFHSKGSSLDKRQMTF